MTSCNRKLIGTQYSSTEMRAQIEKLNAQASFVVGLWQTWHTHNVDRCQQVCFTNVQVLKSSPPSSTTSTWIPQRGGVVPPCRQCYRCYKASNMANAWSLVHQWVLKGWEVDINQMIQIKLMAQTNYFCNWMKFDFLHLNQLNEIWFPSFKLICILNSLLF